MILGEKIVQLRKQRGWSQEELASQLGISRQAVSKWESAASIPDLDKIISMSRLFEVSIDYLLKEEMTEDAPPIVREKEETDSLRSVSLEEATGFLDLTRKAAAKIAFGVACCILSPICLLLLGGLSEYGRTPRISEDMAGSLGTTVLLIMVAVGAAILVSNGIRLDKYGYMEKEPFILMYGVAGIVEKHKEKFAPLRNDLIKSQASLFPLYYKQCSSINITIVNPYLFLHHCHIHHIHSDHHH